MIRVAAADRRAFEALYLDTSAMLFGIVLRINRNQSHAEEVLQEVFITIWRQASTFDASQGRVLTWLTTIARHRAIDSMRRKSTQPVTISRFGGLDAEGVESDLLDQMPSDQPGPMELLDDASQAHELHRCMEGLTGEQRSSLALAYYQGFSHAEVAEHLRQPLGTVKSWVRRGLLKLRTCLDKAAARLDALGRAA
jgi:RNA polymerase sigma factor (sigma-70 family)